ncbi:MAG: hypothetical protein ACOC0N_07330 [Chroococcales cyanobacterium]
MNEESIVGELPDAIAHSLTKKLEALPIPTLYQTRLETAIAEALSRWKDDPNTIHSLIVLGSPAEEIGTVLNSIFKGESFQDLPIRRCFDERPQDYRDIVSKLKTCVSEESGNQPNQEFVLIPDLTDCFLRCINGLDGILYLRNAIAENRSCFWVIGCNYWAWQYLDYICHTHAAFEESISLPVLMRSHLQEYLFDINSSIEKEFELTKKTTEDAYWERLTGISSGIPRVAKSLWLRSFSTESSDSLFIQNEPNLPNPPDLSGSDRYLLYSLILHEKMTLSQLASSLGENDSFIHSEIQELRKIRVIQGDLSSLQLNPIYYPWLRLELDRNNFLVGGKN